MGSDGWPNIIGGKQDYASAADLNNCFYNSSFVASNTDKRFKTLLRLIRKNTRALQQTFVLLATMRR